jgi:hypothetical protein
MRYMELAFGHLMEIIIAGSFLFGRAACGVGAALLWASSGQIIKSYPLKVVSQYKLHFFYLLSYLGAVIGGIIPVAQNHGNTEAVSVNTGTCAATTIIMIAAVIVPFALASPTKIIRNDGTRVVVHPAGSIMQELRNMVNSLKKDPMFLLFLPFGTAVLFYVSFQANDLTVTSLTLEPDPLMFSCKLLPDFWVVVQLRCWI